MSDLVGKLRPAEKELWERFLAPLPFLERPREPFIVAEFAGGRDATDHLLDLYLAGKKSAGSSMVKDFLAAGDPLPKAGNFWILLDSEETPRLLLETLRTEIHLFKDVPESIAIAEGEGDLSLEHWRKVHRAAFAPYLSKWGIPDLETAEVITEHFQIHDV